MSLAAFIVITLSVLLFFGLNLFLLADALKAIKSNTFVLKEVMDMMREMAIMMRNVK